MKDLILRFPFQLKEALQIGEGVNLKVPDHEIRNILITGMGGSGMGGDIISSLLFEEISVPIVVNHDYFIPAFVDQHTLVITSSYSGNTEETLHAFNMAQSQKAHVVCITSNGRLMQLANEHNIDVIQIPDGFPPRTCLGYSMVQQFYILYKLGFIGAKYAEDILAAADLLESELETIKLEATSIAKQLEGKLPVIYSFPEYEAASIRFRQQLNENAKVLSWHHTIPEMNHNELVGWREKNEKLAVMFLRSEDEFGRNEQRLEICRKVFEKYTSTIIDIYAKGENRTQKMIYLIHMADWISLFLAVLKNMDPVEIEVIDFLKEELSKSPMEAK